MIGQWLAITATVIVCVYVLCEVIAATAQEIEE